MITAGMIGAGTQALGGLISMGQGLFGKKKRQREIDQMIAERPKYEIPKEVGQDVANRRDLVNSRLDEQQDLVNNLNTDKANTLNTVRQSSGSLEDMLAVGASADAQSQDSLLKARASGAQERSARREGLSEALSNLSGYRDQAFKLNELDPYNQKVKMTMDNNNASREMITGGLKAAGAGATNLGTAGNAAGLEGSFFS
jgi:hypothetical protein|tara:strand:- start:748 stop:1347 length:600 start_codon:yes stop_codon:yes gene_type:complete